MATLSNYNTLGLSSIQYETVTKKNQSKQKGYADSTKKNIMEHVELMQICNTCCNIYSCV